MRRHRPLRRVASAASLLILGAALPIQADAPGNDVIVTARRLRSVGITFSAAGRHLRRCDVTRSSGIALVDRTMCALLQTCLFAGETGRVRAGACVNARIEDMASGSPAIVAGRGVDHSGSFEPAPVTGGADDDGAATTDEASGDVVVTAKRQVLRPGRWTFTEVSWGTDRGERVEGPFVHRWRHCVRPRQTEAGLTQALSPQGYFGAPGLSLPDACRWRIKSGGGTLTGRQLCFDRSLRRTGEMEGRYTADGVELTKQRHWRQPGKSDKHASYELSGTREGDCG